MAPYTQRYILVLRHAQRLDEVQEDWADVEATRPRGRPWDPPLSRHGLAQAEGAAIKLAAWERHTGARIVAIVTSPFLRCLQTAAAACRHLRLQELHISWAFSEALCRVAAVPAGPLPSWMWPRVTRDAQPGGGDFTGHSTACTGRGAGLSPEEYLGQLGAAPAGVVTQQLPRQPAAADAAPLDAPAEACLQGVAEERGEQTGRPGGGLVVAAAGAAPWEGGRCQPDVSIGPILQGLVVTVLPPPVDLAAAPEEAHISAAAACNGATGGPASDADGDTAPGSQVSHEENEGESGEVVGTAHGGLSVAPGGICRDTAQQPNAAGESNDSVTDRKRGHSGRSELCPRESGPPNYRSDHRNGWGQGLGPDVAAEHFEGSGFNTRAAEIPALGVPYSPETLGAAHARYRAALSCLMAAAAAAGPSAPAAYCMRGLRSEPTWPDTGSIRVPASEVTGVAPTADAQAAQLGPWRALWQAGEMRRAGGAAGEGAGEQPPTATVPLTKSDTVEGEGHEEQAPGGTSGYRPLRRDPEPAQAVSPTARSADRGSTEYVDTHGSEDGSEEILNVRALRRQPVSQLDAQPCGGSSRGAAGLGERRRQPGEPPGEAVLVVTHGEAVACAAATVAPWALVYEVLHTGFVVLEAGKWEGEGDEAVDQRHGGGSGDGADGGGGCPIGAGGRGAAAAWELAADPYGDRGVLWMSTFEE